MCLLSFWAFSTHQANLNYKLTSQFCSGVGVYLNFRPSAFDLFKGHLQGRFRQIKIYRGKWKVEGCGILRAMVQKSFPQSDQAHLTLDNKHWPHYSTNTNQKHYTIISSQLQPSVNPNQSSRSCYFLLIFYFQFSIFSF